jgi:hypothetical protein
MRTLIAGVLKRSALAAHNLVSQVVVSVVAAICVAVISNSYFEKPADVAPVQRLSATEQADTPIAPQQVVQSTPTHSAAPEVSEPARIPIARPAPPRRQAWTKPALPKPRERRVAEIRLPAAAIPATLAPVGHGTEIFDENAAAAPPLPITTIDDPAARARILGLPLPRFVPTFDGVAQSVGVARDKVAAVVEDIRD